MRRRTCAECDDVRLRAREKVAVRKSPGGGALNETTRFLRRQKRLLQVPWDCLSWVAAGFFVVGSRYEVTLSADSMVVDLPVPHHGLPLQVVVGTSFMLYRGRYRTGSFEEITGLATTAAIVAAIAGPVSLIVHPGPEFPRALAVLIPPLALLSMAAGRWCFRTITRARSVNGDAEKIIIYGAGNAVSQLVRLLVSESFRPPTSRWVSSTMTGENGTFDSTGCPWSVDVPGWSRQQRNVEPRPSSWRSPRRVQI